MTTWAEHSARLGRNDMPGVLAHAVLVHHTLTDPAEVAKGVTDAWTMAEWPLTALDEGIWWMLFDAATEDPLNYLHDGRVVDRAELPAEVTLYRGAIEGREYGMSWTDDLARARWFARRFNGMRGSTDGKVWQVTVDTEVVLARFQDRRGEAEWVLDPHLIEGYEVTEVPNQD